MYTLRTYLNDELISVKEVENIEEASIKAGAMFTDVYVYYIAMRDSMRYTLEVKV